MNTGDGTSRARINQVREDLTPRFGGLTLYRNAPAEALWDGGDMVEEDAIIVAEVKGFAVVAQEVREPAHRSGSAAKEIKGLIQNSSKEVESGVKFVRDTGQALKTIVSFITQINQHMDAIATSSKEAVGRPERSQRCNQSNGPDHVAECSHGGAITAASASLAQEAQKLRELVRQFKPADAVPDQSRVRPTAIAIAQPAAGPTVQRASARR